MRRMWMTLALASAVLLTSEEVAAQSRVLTIEDILNVEPGAGRGAEPIRTPDGRFEVSLERGQIVLRPTAGGETKFLTSTPAAKSEIDLSPDGKRVSFISEGQVWVAGINGAPVELTHDTAGPGDPRGATDHRPQWNPDGRWILYEAGKNGFNELYAISADGGSPHLLAATEIYHGKDVIAKTTAVDHGDAVASDRFDAAPHWSPDGTRLSYTERSREFFSGKLKVLPFEEKTGKPAGAAVGVYVAKNDPGGAWAINTAVWSPDGRTLAVVLQETHWDKIWTVSATGGKPKEITFGEGEDEDPVYSPDGRWIAFESNRGLPEERHIWVVPSAGGEPHRITHLNGFETAPHWTSGGGIAFRWRSTLGASATYVADAAGQGDPKLQGAVHPSPFEGLGLTPEIVHFKSKDGTPLAGILYKPAGYAAGTRYPAVILPHGGPEGQVTLSAAPWSLFLADHDYVVLEPNFRGSTGYGERFRNANVEDSGGGEIDDIAASVKYLVDAGFADPKRVGISGGSHGGTVVANAVAKLPDTFAVGIEKFGVVDRALFLRYTNRNSAIRWETKMGGPPESKPTVYRKANILPDVANIKTPLLILHGAEDPQVPPQESQQFAAALKAAGKTFTYITYPGEGHGFRQRDHRKDAYEKEFAFLNHYLQPAAGE